MVVEEELGLQRIFSGDSAADTTINQNLEFSGSGGGIRTSAEIQWKIQRLTQQLTKNSVVVDGKLGNWK